MSYQRTVNSTLTIKCYCVGIWQGILFWEVESGLFGIFDLKKSFEKTRLFCGSSKRVWKPNIGSNYAPATWLHGARCCTHLPAPTLARLDKLEKSSTSSIQLKPPWCKTIFNSANVLTFYVNIVINMFFIHVSLAGENPAGLQTNGAPGLHQLCFGPTNPSLGLLFSFLWASLQIIFVSRWRFQ